VQIANREEFETTDIRFKLGHEGASVQVEHASDIPMGTLQDVGGVACILTTKTATFLEYEIHGVYGAYDILSFMGSVQVEGGAGRLIAERLQNMAAEGESPEHAIATTTQVDHTVAQGYVDKFSRKQGVWTVIQTDGSRMQVGWWNGIPNGAVLRWDSKGRLRSLWHFANGFLEGERMQWYENGVLRSVESLYRGRLNGRRTTYHANGAKASEVKYDQSIELGEPQKWTPDGRSAETGIKHLDASIDARQLNVAWDSFLRRVDSLHTRPK
jgi:hypothetical protein